MFLISAYFVSMCNKVLQISVHSQLKTAFIITTVIANHFDS